MIYVGDTHGKTTQLEWMIKHNPRLQEKDIFQLGDMGLGFKGVELKEFPNLKFIRGNHDDPAKCKAHPNYAGEYGYIPEESLFFLGGAWSIDAKWRIPGISWWEDEEQSLEELNKAYQLYVETKPRIVATHEAPTKAAIMMLNGLPGQYYSEKKQCVNTRTSQVLQQMFDVHKPEHWVFGHYHITTEFDIEGCKFQCLDELTNMEITLEEKA